MLAFQPQLFATEIEPQSSDEWFTDRFWLELTRELFGGVIELDPATCEVAQQQVKALQYFTAKDDGLNQDWLVTKYGLWLNPPFSKPFDWIDKLIGSYQLGLVKQAVVIVKASPNTRWWHLLAANASRRCEPSQRVKYWHPTKNLTSPNFESVLFYLGRETERFESLFNPYGLIFGAAIGGAA